MLKFKRSQGKFNTWKVLLVIVLCFIIQFSYPVLCEDNTNCTATGRFGDPNDPECRKYIVCIGRGSEIIKFTLSCTPTAIFDPERKICTSSNTFLCAAAKSINENHPYNASLLTQDNTNNSSRTNTTESRNNGDSVTKDSHTEINALTNEAPLPIDQNPIENKTNSTFSKVTGFDVTNKSILTNLIYKVTTNSSNGDKLVETNVSNNPIIFDPSKYCQRKGLMQNPHSENCSKFILCTVIRDSYTAIVLECPSSTLFDPETSFCEFTSKCKSWNSTTDLQNVTQSTGSIADYETIRTTTSRDVEDTTLAPSQCNWWCRIDNFVGKLFR